MPLVLLRFFLDTFSVMVFSDVIMKPNPNQDVSENIINNLEGWGFLVFPLLQSPIRFIAITLDIFYRSFRGYKNANIHYGNIIT